MIGQCHSWGHTAKGWRSGCRVVYVASNGHKLSIPNGEVAGVLKVGCTARHVWWAGSGALHSSIWAVVNISSNCGEVAAIDYESIGALEILYNTGRLDFVLALIVVGIIRV